MSGPSPETDEARTIIGSKAQLVAYLEQGSRQRDAWRIGTEHEKFRLSHRLRCAGAL